MDLDCTEEQRAAITAPFTKPIAIIACPGSGKTYTIIHRVAHLIQSNFKPSELLVITFTRKAAQELRLRLKSMELNIKGLTVQTFHSFGLSILRRYKHLLGIGEFRIISQKEQMELLGSIAKATPNKEILLRLQIYKTQGQCDDDLRPIFDSYNKELRKMNSCDFTDLIVLPLEILNRNPEVVNYYQRRFKYALIDEMQDVSKVQFDFMKVLFGDRGKLTVVGDDDQTIYSWRGADPHLLLQFSKVYKESTIIWLTNCFRCPPHIVKSMSKVIQHNKSRVQKTIESKVKSNSPLQKYTAENRRIKKITVFHANSMKDEAALIVGDLKKYIGHGTIAILFRTRKAAQHLKAEMARQSVKASVYDRARFLESQDVNVVLNILQMAVGISFNESLVKDDALNVIRTGIVSIESAKRKDEKKKEASLDSPSKADLVAASTGDGSAKLSEKVESPLKKFLSSDSDFDIDGLIEGNEEKGVEKRFLLSDDDDFDEEEESSPSESDNDFDFVRKSLKRMSPLQAVTTITKSLNMTSESVEFLVKEAEEMQNNDDEIISFQDEYNQSNHLSLVDFLYSVRTSTTEETLESLNVHMSTVHQAKGLEWDYVYIIGATKGSWPSSSSTSEDNIMKLEEERRLFYVAMSRAKKELAISFLAGKGPSMFIEEIPEIFIKEKIHKKTEVIIKNDEKEQTVQPRKFAPNDLKFTKVSLLPESQPSNFSNNFISGKNLKLDLVSDSQGKSLSNFHTSDQNRPKNLIKKRSGKPQLILQEEPIKSKQTKFNLF